VAAVSIRATASTFLMSILAVIIRGRYRGRD
jgi:hypothetical protein